MISHSHFNIGDLFHERAASWGSNIALAYEDGSTVTYDALRDLSDRALNGLTALGIGRFDVVFIFNRKSPAAFATMIACLRLGAIYANIDTSIPTDRLARTLERCRPATCVYDEAQADIAELLEEIEVPYRALESLCASAAPRFQKRCPSTGSDPAYIMFTSGSTGTPKGVVISHDNLAHFLEWSKRTFDILPQDVFTNVNPIYFDNSVFDFYSALWWGATLCPISRETAGAPKQLVSAVEALGCTVWFSVPSMLVYLLTTKSIKPNSFPALRTISFGGEGFPKKQLKELYDFVGDRIELVNVYGPTECTCICSSVHLNESEINDDSQLAPIGPLAPNFDFRVEMADQSENVGELVLYGPGVGLGYYNDPEKSAVAFRQDPQCSTHRRIGYHTGDLVEVDARGTMRFKGRVDNQIKHMGHRIELEEIEIALARIDGIDETGVVYKETPQGTGMIVAYASTQTDLSSAAIKKRLRELLPGYMVPNRVVLTDQPLGKNANGKIDRKALRAIA